MERLARGVIDSKNIRCHVEFEYHPLHNISISTRFADILPRMSDQREIPFHALKCLTPVERNSSRGEGLTFPFPLRVSTSRVAIESE